MNGGNLACSRSKHVPVLRVGKRQSLTALFISSRRVPSFSGGMSGRFLPMLLSISSRIWSVHLAWTRPLCAMRMSRSRCALPYSALAS